MSVAFRLAFALGVILPAFASLGLPPPIWQTFLVAVVAFGGGRLLWPLVRARPVARAAVFGLSLAACGAGAYGMLAATRAQADLYVEVDGLTADRRLRVHGWVVPGSVTQGPVTRFDLKGKAGSIPVELHAPAPEQLRDGMDAVVSGRLRGGVFQADAVQLKCPDNYDRTKGEKPF